MSPEGIRRAAVASILGLAVWAGLARAANPWITYPAGKTSAPPGVVANPDGYTRWGAKLRRKLGLGCWASFDGYGTGSLKSDFVFIFGSSRAFFGEPCLAGPPPSPLPPWVNTATPGSAGGPPAHDPWGPDSPWAPGAQGGFPHDPVPAKYKAKGPIVPYATPAEDGWVHEEAPEVHQEPKHRSRLHRLFGR